MNGSKIWTSAGQHANWMFCLVRTDREARAQNGISFLLIDLTSPGVSFRPIRHFFGAHVFNQFFFDDVRVPVENLLLGEGRGFEIAQGRLGPGRIHHCMRIIGVAERALEMMCQRAAERVTWGKAVGARGVTQERIAQSRIEIDMCRLLTLKAADRMDKVGNKEARQEIAMIKVAAPNMALEVIDRAMQVHGGGAMSQEFPLSYMWSRMRALRFADGPDEVHRRQIARLEQQLQGTVPSG